MAKQIDIVKLSTKTKVIKLKHEYEDRTYYDTRIPVRRLSKNQIKGLRTMTEKVNSYIDIAESYSRILEFNPERIKR